MEKRPGASRTFEKLVAGEDDLVGLIAYSLYKRAKQEWSVDSRSQEEADKYCEIATGAHVANLRTSAETKLNDFAQGIYDQYESELRQELTREISSGLKQELLAELRGHITDRTRFLSSVAAGVVAWIVSLLITLLVAYSLLGPDFREVFELRTSPSPSAATP